MWATAFCLLLMIATVPRTASYRPVRFLSATTLRKVLTVPLIALTFSSPVLALSTDDAGITESVIRQFDAASKAFENHPAKKKSLNRLTGNLSAECYQVIET